MKVGPLTILISDCIAGIYLRWWYNGWHYFNFQNGYEVVMSSESMDTQVTRMFSIISKIERPTKLKAEYSYQVTLTGITGANIPGFTGLLMAEKVEQYEDSTWYEVDITRGNHLIKNPDTDAYIFKFEITRKELPNTSTVMQNSTLLYLDDTLCDLDDDEVIPINKQVNDIAEMQDRQSDYTAQFRIRKTRAMRALFELSGEVGANTTFPYERQTARLVQDAVEIITNGELILDRVDSDYYYVSILSGNLSFFKAIDGLKITDLALASTNHTWDIATMAGTHTADLDYLYPLCEPSDDANLSQIITTDDLVSYWGGYIWPFIKVKAIWDEIFLNAGFTVTGDILTNERFLGLFMSIENLSITKASSNNYNYYLFWRGHVSYTAITQLRSVDGNSVTLITGTEYFRVNQEYIVPYTATYTFRVGITGTSATAAPIQVWVYKGGVPVAELIRTTGAPRLPGLFVGEYEATVNDALTFYVTAVDHLEKFSIGVIDIVATNIGYGTDVTPHINLPDMTQTEFIKMICNMFGLIPDAVPRDKTINFWNYDELYDNIAIARNWEAYLSETDDEVTFKYGEYAQKNYLRYKDSEDVQLDQGAGIMTIDDTTLPEEREVVQLPLATCDEVTILVDVVVSRIAFNVWDDKTNLHEIEDNIDPRIVFMSNVDYSATSPLYEKTMRLRTDINPDDGTFVDIVTPKKITSLPISFSELVINYASLSKLLTKTNLRRSKFNLPVYEVAGLKYQIPIYIPQYKAYFYINKISNYVNGKLCSIDLIKL